MAGLFHAPSLAGGMGQVARAAVVYGKAVPTTTHKNSNRLSAEDRDAQCTHTATLGLLTDERWHTVPHTHAKQLKKLES